MNRNWLKKFMQVGVDVTYMHTNFGERDLSGFRDIATFKNGKFRFPVIKKFNQSESAQKFMQVGIDVTCMQTNFGGHCLFGFGEIATFKNSKFPFPTMDYIVHGHQKI